MKTTLRATLAALLLTCAPARAAETPAIVGTIANRAGGEIVLTMRATKDCTKQEGVFVYIRNDGGKVSSTGCWRVDDTTIFVFWDDGEVYTYPAEAVRFTEEWLEYEATKNRKPTNPQERTT
jgi:hypothetical protein